MSSRLPFVLAVTTWIGACAATTEVPDGERTRAAFVFEVDESVVIERDVDVVFAYVADFRNDATWRSEVVRMDVASPGAPALGTRTTEVARVLGEDLTTVTEVIRYDEGREITARTVAGAPLWLSSERTCERVRGGTRFRYRCAPRTTRSTRRACSRSATPASFGAT